MGGDLWEKMAGLLHKEAQIYSDLVVLGRKKQEALVEGSLSDLEKVVRAEQALIGTAARVEEERWRLQEQLACALGKKAAELRISELIDSVEEPIRSSLESSKNSILESTREMARLNEENSSLIQQSLSYVNFMLSAMTSRTGGPYDREGDRRTSSPVSLMDSKA